MDKIQLSHYQFTTLFNSGALKDYTFKRHNSRIEVRDNGQLVRAFHYLSEKKAIDDFKTLKEYYKQKKEAKNGNNRN